MKADRQTDLIDIHSEVGSAHLLSQMSGSIDHDGQVRYGPFFVVGLFPTSSSRPSEGARVLRKSILL